MPSNRRDFVQQVACAFAAAGVACTVPKAVWATQSVKLIHYTELGIVFNEGSAQVILSGRNWRGEMIRERLLPGFYSALHFHSLDGYEQCH